MSKYYDPASTGTPLKWGVKGAGWGRRRTNLGQNFTFFFLCENLYLGCGWSHVKRFKISFRIYFFWKMKKKNGKKKFQFFFSKNGRNQIKIIFRFLFQSFLFSILLWSFRNIRWKIKKIKKMKQSPSTSALVLHLLE